LGRSEDGSRSHPEALLSVEQCSFIPGDDAGQKHEQTLMIHSCRVHPAGGMGRKPPLSIEN
jgi:hypothetical protein